MNSSPIADRNLWLKDAFDRYESPLIAYAKSLAGDWETARDVAQEAFLKLCQQDPARVGDPPGPWLYRVCRNRIIDLHRARHRRCETPLDETNDPPAPATEPGGALDAEGRQTVMDELLADLTQQQRELVRLKFLHGMSYREIADLTGLTTNLVGVHLHQAVKRMRTRLRSRSAPAAWKELIEP